MIAYEQKYIVTQDDPYLKEMRQNCTEKNGWVITEDTTKVTFKIITWLGERKGETECQRKN